MTDKKDTKVDVPDVESFKVKSDDAKDAKASETETETETETVPVEETKEVPVTVHTPHEPDMTNPMVNPLIPVYEENPVVEVAPQNPAETQDIRFEPDPDAETETVDDEAEAEPKSKSK